MEALRECAMRICPKCDEPVANDSARCPACGAEMPSEQTGTLDIQSHFEDADSEDSEAAPQSGTPPQSSASDMESNSDAAAGEDAHGTLDTPEISASSQSSPKHSEEEADNQTQPSEDAGSAGPAGRDSNQTLPYAGNAAEMDVRGTLPYGDREVQDARQDKGRSGSAGRLRRMWRGAAGSTGNPIHTLKGDDALATDSVFEKVALRVLVTEIPGAIVDSVGADVVSIGNKRQRVEQCVHAAVSDVSAETADYELTGFVGQGGMGVVLKAHQKAIGRDVAIKMIQPSADGSRSSTNAQKKKFFYEAQITGKLDHPNIVPVYELGVSNDVLFYSMKLIIGTEWQNTIQQNTREVNLDIFTKVANAIAFAHQRDIIHRDLKPENIMLGPFGEVLVTDWGCAIDLTRGDDYPLAGSPPWMAPEMADHDVQRIGAKSDIYLLGAILYQLVVGHPPHPGQTVFECLEAAQKNVILPHDSDDPLLQIALRAMETDPEERYATVEAMQEAIREYVQHAESIRITERSAAALTQAIEAKDYERFSKAMFGFQEALELWHANSAAQTGLGQTRLAYAECAFRKADFDLCLQTLDPSIPVEAELSSKAQKAKQASEERESRLKALRLGLMAVIAASMIGLAAFLYIVNSQKQTLARTNNELAVTNNELEEQKIALEERRVALEETNKELEETIDQRDDAIDAEKKAKEKVESTNMELEDQKIALEETNKELKTTNERLDKTNEELRASNATIQKQFAQIQLNTYQPSLGLAVAQLERANVVDSSNSLRSAEEQLSSAEFVIGDQQVQPFFKNWAWNRVNLLSNSELLSDSLGERVTAACFAENINRGLIATVANDGTAQLHAVQLQGNQLRPIPQLSTHTLAAVDSVAISDDGSQAVYSVDTGGEMASVFTWQLDAEQEPADVASIGRRPMQTVAITGQQVIGGINGGMWIWNRHDPTIQERNIPSVRGRLLSLQLLPDSEALVLADLNNRRFVHKLDLTDLSTQRIEFQSEPDSDMAQRISAVAMAEGKLIIGTLDGRLFTSDLTDGVVGPEYQEIVPQRHQTAIRSIQVHADGTLLTVADEPVVHLWKRSRMLTGWMHDAQLMGTPANVGAIAFMTKSSLVMGFDEQGRSIVWDTLRQKQRRRLSRIDDSGETLEYQSPVVDVVPSERWAISIHQDGTLDTWDPQTGQSIGDTHANRVPGMETPLSFIGHSPKAAFIDMSVDTDSATLVSSAVHPPSEGRAERTWEFCRWDIASGKLLDFWTREAANRQEISLLDSGELIQYSSDSHTLIKRIDDHRMEEESLSDAYYFNPGFGAYFARSNPIDPAIVLLVKRSGDVRVLNRDKLAEPLVELAETSRIRLLLNEQRPLPLVGEWSPDGKRFYLLWESGRVTEFGWENNTLTVERDVRSKTLRQVEDYFVSSAADETLVGTAADRTIDRVNSKWRVDLQVRSEGDFNLAYVGFRFPGNEGRTRLMRIAFPKGDGEPSFSLTEKSVSNNLLVMKDTVVPEFTGDVYSRLPVDRKEVVAARSFGDQIFVATESADIYTIDPDGTVKILGRPEVISGSGNLQADRIITLHAGGFLWRGDFQQDRWNFTRLSKVGADATRVQMSPDGEYFLITQSNGVSVHHAADGSLVEDALLDNARAACWTRAGVLLLARKDGVIEQRKTPNGPAERIGQFELGGEVVGLHIFIEKWQDREIPTRWIVIESPDEIHYMAWDSKLDPGDARFELPPGSSILSCSPHEGVFLTGSREGSVGVHFASPSLGEYGKRLFDLEGHAGATIQSIGFTPDGETVITSDAAARVYGWLSSDKFQGVRETVNDSPK